MEKKITQQNLINIVKIEAKSLEALKEKQDLIVKDLNNKESDLKGELEKSKAALSSLNSVISNAIEKEQKARKVPEAKKVPESSTSATLKSIFELDYYRTTFTPNSWYDTMIEIITYPILFAIIKSIVFITIIICTAEVCTRYYNNYNFYCHHHHHHPNNKAQTRQHHALTHRDVPHVITTSVVMASLGIILADWGFSRLWLQRH